MSYTPQWGPGQSGQSQPYGHPQSGGYGQSDSGGYGSGFGSGGYGSNPGQYGSDPYGGGGFGQYGPNQPPPQQPFGGFGPPSGPPPQPPRRRRRWGGLVRFLVLIAIIGGIAVAWPNVIRPALAKFGNKAAQEVEDEAKKGARSAQAGECVVDKNAPGAASAAPADSDDVKLRVVACDGPEAAYKVLGVVNNKLQSEANAANICDAYPESDVVYWEGYTGKPGLVLCLQDLTKTKK